MCNYFAPVTTAPHKPKNPALILRGVVIRTGWHIDNRIANRVGKPPKWLSGWNTTAPAVLRQHSGQKTHIYTHTRKHAETHTHADTSGRAVLHYITHRRGQNTAPAVVQHFKPKCNKKYIIWSK